MYHEVTAAITEELGEWPGSSRRIDWLCFDSDTNFVVSETQTIVIHIEFACVRRRSRSLTTHTGVALKD
jgi:hypothetical protein